MFIVCLDDLLFFVYVKKLVVFLCVCFSFMFMNLVVMGDRTSDSFGGVDVLH